MLLQMPQHTPPKAINPFSRIISVSLLVVTLAALIRIVLPRNLAQPHSTFEVTFQRATKLQNYFSSKPFIQTHTMAYTYETERLVAELAVTRAAILTKRVFHEKAKGTLNKDDKSPVTIGDFGAQALIIQAIKSAFPDDEVVGEEEATELRQDETLREQIWALVNSTRLDDMETEKIIGGPIPSVEAMLDAIDAGNSAGGANGRIWALDPIDGTKGFLRGGQYAVCLGLMVDGDVKVGVLGCPNLPIDDSVQLTGSEGANQEDGAGKGVLFSAAQGQGAISRALTTGALAESKPIKVRSITNVQEATFCESVEAAHSSHDDQSQIAQKLGISKPSVRMDSQAKYGSVARGAGDIYLRLPVSATYVEKIWDHAAGDLIVREAGGEVTDATGKRLDFSKGRTLAENKGVVAAPKQLHPLVIEVVKDVLGKKEKL